LLWAAALAVAFPAAALASCGAENCPLDHASRWSETPFNLEISYQYIDQNQPRIGTESVAIGAITRDHDEIRTLNRATTARASYRFGGGWSVGAALPYIERFHAHNHNDPGGAEYERWNYSGIGDLELSGLRSFGGAKGSSRYFATAGVKTPTGVTDVRNAAGEQPEPAARPGTGSWDFLAGAGGEWRLGGSRADDTGGSIPLRLSVTGRLNGRGTEKYRIGPQVQVHLASELPVGNTFALLGQANFRVKGKDNVGTSGLDEADTGGTWFYLSPGLRVTTGQHASIYGMVQLPVYQRVNGIQLVSDLNLYFGMTGGI
ncbi:MAG TPA: hypothetical protein VIX13_04825, partial [Candidatus Eisenbacteria bacterium]